MKAEREMELNDKPELSPASHAPRRVIHPLLADDERASSSRVAEQRLGEKKMYYITDLS